MTEYAYRFEEIRFSLGTDQWGDPLPGSELGLQCHSYPIVRRTPKGMWVNVGSGNKFVLLTANKRFADPCKKQAWEDFKHRKQRQITIYEARLRDAKEALTAAQLPLEDAVRVFNINGGLFDAT